MAQQTERLLLQVDAATELLRRELLGAEQPLNRFEKRAATMAEAVDKSIGGMGGRFGAFAQLAESSAERAQKSFEASFSQVQKLAATAIKGPTIDGRVNLGADDIRDGAAAAQEQARAFALIGEAAERAALKQQDTSEATRIFIQATAASRIEAERKAAALLAEAGALERVEIELRESAAATDLFVGKHQRLAQAADADRQLAIASRDAATAQKALAASADVLRGQIDPMFAAQKRFDAEMDRADDLYRAGAISLREYGQAQQFARDALQAHAVAVAGATPATAQLASGQRAVATSSGAMRAAMQGASFQVQDTLTQLSLGANVFQVVSIQGAQLAGQFANIEGKAGSFARFMIGPYGLLITAAAMFVPVIARTLEFGDALDDAVDKLRADAAEAETAARAKKRFDESIEGVTAALREQDEALRRSAEGERTAAERANISAKVTRDRALAARENTAALLAEALAQEQIDKVRSGAPGQRGENASLALAESSSRAAGLEAALAKANAAVQEAERAVNVTRVDLAAEQAAVSLDPIRSVTKLYDERIKALKDQQREEARLGKQIGAAASQRLRELEAEKKAAVEAAQARQSAQRRDERSGPLTTFLSPVEGGRTTGRFNERRAGHNHAGVDYAVPVGTPVRAPAAGVVDVAGQRQGYGNAIYINFGAGTTGRFGHLSRFNVKPGDHVDAGDVIGYSGGAPGAEGSGRSTGPHLHYELRRGGRAVDPRTGRFPTDAGAVASLAAKRGDATERRAEAARVKLLREDSAFTDQERKARQQLLDATRRTAESEEQRDALLRESIAAEADATERKIANQFEAGELSLAEAQRLHALNEATRAQRLQNVKIGAATRVIEGRYEADEADLQSRLSLLRIGEDMAATEADRRRVAREILDIEQQLRRKALERLRDTSQDPNEVQAARTALGRLPELEQAEVDQQENRLAGPYERYRDRVIAASADIRETLEDSAVRGFDRLADAGASATASAVNDLLGLRGVAGEVIGGVIADLARLAIQQAIVSTIGKQLFGSATGLGFFGLAEGGAIGDLPGFAEGGSPGGRISGPGTGTSDSILAILGGGKGAVRLSAGEYIINERATREYLPLIEAINERRLPRFATGGPLGPMPAAPNLRTPRMPSFAERGRERVAIDAKVKVEASPLLLATVEQTAVRTVGAAAEPIMAGAQARTLRRLGREDLPGGWG